MAPPPSIVGCRGTFEPKRRGVTLDQVALGAVLGAQGRAWAEPRGEWKVKRKEEEDENSEKENGLETAIKYANQWTAYVTAATAIVWSRHSKKPTEFTGNNSDPLILIRAGTYLCTQRETPTLATEGLVCLLQWETTAVAVLDLYHQRAAWSSVNLPGKARCATSGSESGSTGGNN